LLRSARIGAVHWLAIERRQTYIAPTRRTCYKTGMFSDRQTLASRIVLDDRSRLPWRFFGRLTTAALAA
jgi:hypothetical protein